MLIRRKPALTDNDVTDAALYRERRRFIRSGFALAAGASLPLFAGCERDGGENVANATDSDAVVDASMPEAFERLVPTRWVADETLDEELTPYDKVTTYNNFYEFEVDKASPALLAKNFRTRPWEVRVDGECEKPATFGIEDLLSGFPQEERVYRLRCVEAWSMVIPWVGFPLAALLERVRPTSRARYVEFKTLYDPERMPNQRRGVFGAVLDWPYVEGLRMDEAMNELTILGTGLYGRHLPGQNGAPVRLVVPWKYGFKSIKSIVSITLTETQPLNTWQLQAGHEYGFYANVNPMVDHPRWSQARERRIGEWERRETLMFNGYGDYVAHLYAGMDLERYF